MRKTNSSVDVNALILKVRDGDQQAFLNMLDKYKPLIESLVTKFSSDDMAKLHKEDLLQEATLVFYNSILTYDEKQTDVEFGLYARICISNALVSQMRVINRRRVEQLTEPGSKTFSDELTENPVDDIVKQESLRDLYSVIKENLSDYEYIIWHNYMMGKTARDIGNALDKSEKSVSNAIYRIRKKLRGLLK